MIAIENFYQLSDATDREGLAAFGWTVEKLAQEEHVILGYCANHKKQILESPGTISAREIKALLAEGPCKATFGTDEAGKPIAIVELIEQSEGE